MNQSNSMSSSSLYKKKRLTPSSNNVEYGIPLVAVPITENP